MATPLAANDSAMAIVVTKKVRSSAPPSCTPPSTRAGARAQPSVKRLVVYRSRRLPLLQAAACVRARCLALFSNETKRRARHARSFARPLACASNQQSCDKKNAPIFEFCLLTVFCFQFVFIFVRTQTIVTMIALRAAARISYIKISYYDQRLRKIILHNFRQVFCFKKRSLYSKFMQAFAYTETQ